MTGFRWTPVLPKATLVGVLSAQLRPPRLQSATSAKRRFETSLKRLKCANSSHWWTACGTAQIDPKLPFKISPVNGREARKSGLRLKASVANRCHLIELVMRRGSDLLGQSLGWRLMSKCAPAGAPPQRPHLPSLRCGRRKNSREPEPSTPSSPQWIRPAPPNGRGR
jgi:hypothetical protein